jgi:hypothetical protein
MWRPLPFKLDVNSTSDSAEVSSAALALDEKAAGV